MSLVGPILTAAERIGPHLRETPCLESPLISEAVGTRTFLKLENLQVTGSFKARGALNKILGLSPAERERGVVTASSGNHGAAVANAGRRAGLVPTVFLPENAAPIKVEQIRRLGARVEFFGEDSGLTEVHARRVAAERGQVYVSPYNDLEVVAGQGTIGVELLAQCPSVSAVVISVGGGGLIGGIASYLKALRPGILVIGSSPKHSPVMAESVRRGRLLELPSLPTLSDGTAGGVEPGAVTFELCRDLVDQYDLPDEAEIAAGMRLAFEAERLVVEGAAGVAIATALRIRERLAGRDVGILICGANVDPARWCAAVSEPRPGVRQAGS
jgi:threonine dehydratase